MLAKLIAATLATAAGSFAIAFGLPPETATAPVYQIEVTTYDGQLFIAGSGDDCRAAWQGAVVPKGWQEIVCVQAGQAELFPFPVISLLTGE
ncbi:hypothetical protein [Mesorhizobium sp. INR15]|uniref:hypothetical protein n=1 Tax=Mesorhizobium sp. INR15 TaxID=2654248 RepID=UPI001896725D|nr:hypothetical protein [Mesorhizobium sp. INR15]QPC91493.1 hypothetical protein GA829_13210 [Mesorhizobium sp. INR15]